MPGEVISVSIENYPDLVDLQEGDAVTIKGKVSVAGEDGTLEITTESIESNVNTAEKELRTMVPRDKKAAAAPDVDEDEDY